MARGTLRIYLGAAPGVGEDLRDAERGPPAPRARRGRRRRASSRPTAAPSTAEQVGDLEVIPAGSVEYRGTTLEELDVDAVLARRPDDRPGGRAGAHERARARETRSAGRTSRSCSRPGIGVISTVNIQHLESLNDVVEQITGMHQQETVPDEVVRRADQLQLVDLRPSRSAPGSRAATSTRRSASTSRWPTTSGRET